MTRARAEALVREILHGLAPEVDLDAADWTAPLGDELDLDSFGFLSLVQLLSERAGLEVPEPDYEQVSTLEGLVGYLVDRAA